MKLKVVEFGNPVLRRIAADISPDDIKTEAIQALISAMKELLLRKKLGVGLAAPQVGSGLRLAVIAIRPSERRPNAKSFNLTIINPVITQTFGRRAQLYEGCISAGPGQAGLFARVPRFKKIELKFLDETGKSQTKTFEGLAAHVIQHEVDHLNGVLFVDKVKDTTSYMTHKEYLAYIKARRSKKASSAKQR